MTCDEKEVADLLRRSGERHLNNVAQAISMIAKGMAERTDATTVGYMRTAHRMLGEAVEDIDGKLDLLEAE